MSDCIVETRSLKKYFATRQGLLHAVDNVNLCFPRGKTLGVVGESGCGKSTLGRVILKLLEPTSGEILYDGEDIAGYGKQEIKEMRKNMQMIFQDPYASLDPRMSVSEIIAEPLLITKTICGKVGVESRVKELMDIVGLASRLANSYPHELDGGRRQRIGIAKALSLNPKFIVCDEPVSALDVSIQAQILNLLMDLQDEMKLSYMFITHDLSVVKLVSESIVVMYLGQCVEQATSDELFDRPMHPYTSALLRAIPLPSLEGRGKKREILKGEVSSPVNPVPGCRFAPRCTLAGDICMKQDPPLRDVGNGHLVACWRCEKGEV